MSLKLPNFFKARGYLNDVLNYQISSADLRILREALKDDIDAYFVNGLISFSSAVNSLNKDNYSWSFIQSYYSIFYFARAFNGINDFAIVYNGKKPLGIKIQPGERFIKLAGNSHDVVLNQFKAHFGTDTLLANQIENLSPVDWFNENRNHINYTLNPLTDPVPPIDLYNYKGEIRKWICTYFNDTSHSYTFDSRHCFLAYPLQLFNRVKKFYDDNEFYNEYIDESKIEFFKKNIADSKGPISVMISKIVELNS